MMFKQKVARRLRAVRIASGYICVKSFAGDIGIPERVYAQIEEGTRTPSFEQVASIAELTGKSLDFIAFGENLSKA